MSNKEQLKEMFEEKYSANNNYQTILKHIDKKQETRSFNSKWVFAPILALVLIMVSISVLFNGNDIIYINQLQTLAHSPIARYNYLKEEYDIANSHSFVNEIEVPKDLKTVEKGITYEQKEKNIEIHDFIIVYYNNNDNRSVKLSFANKDVDSFINQSMKQNDMKPSKIKNQELLIFAYESYFYVEFEYHNLKFYVETNHIKLQELKKIIASIIK